MFGKVWNGFKKAAKAVVSVAEKGADLAVNCAKKVAEKGTKAWNATTGKTVAEEAKQIFDQAKRKYDAELEKHQAFVKQSTEKLSAKIEKINGYKTAVYENNLARFIKIASVIKNITVKGVPFEELFDEQLMTYKVDTSLRSRNEVLLIDFDNLGFGEIVKGVLTLGFTTRSKANESKTRAVEQEKAMEESIAKMHADQAKLSVLEESIDNVIDYFEGLVSNYALLLDRFEYGVRAQRAHQMSLSVGVVDMKIDFRKMPLVHLEEFQAVFNLSIVLKHMSSLSFIGQNGELIEEDQEKAKHLFALALADNRLVA